MATRKMKMLDINLFVKLCIDYAKTNGMELTHLKLQKTLYYIQAWSIGYFDDQLFEELPQAWVNGPVYPSVYQHFRDMKGASIIAAEDCGLEEDAEALRVSIAAVDRIENHKELLSAVLDRYMSRSAGELVYQTHREKPWIEARIGCSSFDASTTVISKDSMRSYYGGIVSKMESAA